MKLRRLTRLPVWTGIAILAGVGVGVGSGVPENGESEKDVGTPATESALPKSRTPKRFGTLSAGIAVEKPYEKNPAPEPGKAKPEEPPNPVQVEKPTIDDLLKKLLGASGLPARRKNRLLSMAGSAYAANGYRPFWNGANPDIVIERISDTLRSHALDPDAIPQMVPDGPVDWPKTGLAVDDARLTLQVAEASLLLKEGPATKELIWPAWNQGDTPGTIDTATHTKNVTATFTDGMLERRETPEEIVRPFVPTNWIYNRLRAAWVGSEVYPNPDPLNYGGLLRAGTVSDRVREFAVALKFQGYLAAEDLAKIDTKVTPAMSEAIRNFQRDHKLTADGILGPKTLAKLNRDPIRDRQIIVVNMHRARLIPNDMGQRHAIANLPAGELFAIDGNLVKEKMRIVYGRNSEGRRSPIFRDTIEEVIFRPYWWVPTSIAKNELLPKGSSYLARNGYQVVSSKGSVVSMSSSNLSRVRAGTATLRQRSGGNALGLVKFRFPNNHSVYFHDTPQKHLFKYSERAHSHGCIRLEKPLEFADYALANDPDWNPLKIRQAASYGERTIVPLKDPVNVFIVYFTAFPAIGAGNGIRFFDDVYGRDLPSLGTLLTTSEK